MRALQALRPMDAGLPKRIPRRQQLVGLTMFGQLRLGQLFDKESTDPRHYQERCPHEGRRLCLQIQIATDYL